MKKKNILLCNHQCYPNLIGGAEISLLTIVHYLDKEKYRPFILSPKEGKFTDTIDEMGLKQVIIPYEMLWDMISPYRNVSKSIDQYTHKHKDALQKITKYIQEQKIDVILSNSIVNILPLLAARKNNVPTMLFIREIIYPSADTYANGFVRFLYKVFRRYGGWFYTKALESSIHQLSGITVYVSKTCQTRVIHKISSLERDVVLNPPIRNEIFEPYLDHAISINRKEKMTVGFFGLLLSHKGIEDYIEIALNVTKQMDGIEFIIVGGAPDPQYREYLHRKIASTNNIHFIGYKENLGPVYEKTDIICFPSISEESFGKVVTEGMFLGKTIIAYDTGSIREIIETAVNGFIVPKRDRKAVEELIIQLYENRKRLYDIGENAMTHTRTKYDPRQYVQKLEGYIAQLK